jgi:hypothetical protein
LIQLCYLSENNREERLPNLINLEMAKQFKQMKLAESAVIFETAHYLFSIPDIDI